MRVQRQGADRLFWLPLLTTHALQAGWYTHTYPEVMLKALNFAQEGALCMPDKAPVYRQLDFNSASNLYADAEEVSLSGLGTASVG